MVFDLIFILGAMILCFMIFRRRVSFQRYPYQILTVFFLGILGLLYLSVLSISIGSYLFLLPLSFLLLFCLAWKREKRDLKNGFLLNLFLIAAFLLVIYLRMSLGNPLLLFLGTVVIAIFALLLTFGFAALLVFLFINTRIVIKRERVRLANLLTLIVAILLICLELFRFLGDFEEVPLFIQGLLKSVPFLVAYYYFIFINYLVSVLLVNLHRPRFNKDYVIILGAGLINGRRVTPLLHSRIMRGIDFAYQQKQATGILPKLIMSGGQGRDEQVSEAQAMAEDAVENGFPKNQILLEDQSTTTMENLKFSRKLMEEDSGTQNSLSVISTNNYHLFRAIMYAQKIGLDADGIGAKTARYYIPNGFLREFIAYLAARKWLHLLSNLLLILLNIAFVYLAYYFV